MMINRVIIAVIATLAYCGAMAQTSLEQCHQLARANYPLIKQYRLIEQTMEYNIKNATSAHLPQLSLSAKATYQSDVTSVPIPTISPLPKDQYQAVVEVSQTIWDGGAVSASKQNIERSYEVENKRLEVDLYAIRERVNNLFFGILMLDSQLEMNSLLDQELWRNLHQVNSMVENGIAYSADIDAVNVEIISNLQQRFTISTSRKAYIDMLSAMTGTKITNLAMPPIPSTLNNQNRRPELDLFAAQQAQAQSMKATIRSNTMPKIGAFVQGAYGNPGLNMLKAGFTPYAIGGLRLSWNIGGFYTKKSDIAKISTQQQSIEVQQKTFLFNTDLSTTQTNAEIEKLRQQMHYDDQIIIFRENIRKSAEARTHAGTLSVTDMLREVTAENSARQTKTLHQIELIKSIYDLKNTVNN